MNETQNQLIATLDAALAAAVAASEALQAFETTTAVQHQLAFTGLSAQRVENWRSLVADVQAGTRSTSEP